MKNFILSLGIVFTVVGCAADKNEPEALAKRYSMDEVKYIVGETDAPICSLQLQPELSDHDSNFAKHNWGEFVDYNAYARRVKAASGSDFVQYTRRAALHRLLHVPEGADVDTQKYYDALDDGIAEPKTFEQHVAKIDYWDARIREQHTRDDRDSGDYNMRFCVINDKGGVPRAQAYQFILDGLAAKTLTFEDHLNGFLQGREFLAPLFKRTMIQVGLQAQDDGANLAHIALLRSRTTALIDTDPKTADGFWQARDAEIDAVLTHIDSHNFESGAKKLKAMTSIDQSLRHLFGAVPVINAHFGNKDEAKTMRDGIGARVSRIDEFNTVQLEEMLEGRGWITDASDGKGAANSAWLIAQHADQNPDFQRRVLVLMKDAFDAPGVSKRNYAYLYDRVAGKDKKPQRYGTQGRCTGPGTWEPHELEDADKVDAWRAEVGLGPLAEYKTRFINSCFEDQRQK